MKISINIECNTVAEAQQILAQLNAQAPTAVQQQRGTPTRVDTEPLALKYLDEVPYIDGSVDDQKLRFGKYKNTYSPRELLDVNPQYLVWACENMDWKPCSLDCENAARRRIGADVVALAVPELPSFDQFDADIPF